MIREREEEMEPGAEEEAVAYKMPDDLEDQIKYWNKIAHNQPKKLEKLEILVDKRDVVAKKAKRKGLAPAGEQEKLIPQWTRATIDNFFTYSKLFRVTFKRKDSYKCFLT